MSKFRVTKGIMMSIRFHKAALLTGSIMAGAVFATPVWAQQEAVGTNAGVQDEEQDLTDQETSLQAAPDDDGGLIVVTGSRIAQRNVSTAAPIAVVQDEEFKLSGAVNVENVINTLPQVIPGTTSFSNNPGNGTATLNLRGLGTNRNIVLVNGRRWIFFDTTQVVDLNTIPQFLIDSVEVVTGGASAVYGSDALAGVVNFRLRDIEGVELGGQYNLTERGDAAAYQLNAALGAQFDDGRGSATVFAEYFNREAVFQGAREFSNFALGGESFGAPLQQFGSSTVPQGRINTAGTGVIRSGTGAGTTLPLGAGLLIDDAFFTGPGVARPRVGTDTYNYAPANFLQLPQERYLIGGYADYEFADGQEFFTEIAYVNNRVATELAPTPVTGTFTINIDTVAPFVSPAILAELRTLDQREAAINAARTANGLGPLFTDVATTPFDESRANQAGFVNTFIQRRVQETGPRNSLDERNAFRVLAGVRGGLTDSLNYDAYYSYARTRNANVQAGNISRSAFQAGLDGTGTPINIFGPNTLTDDQVDAITIQAQNGEISTLEVANAAISGLLGNLGFGADDLGFAVGVEYRRVAAEFLPDTALSSGDVIGFNAGDATEGDYDVREVFAEVNLPILDFDSGLRLELTGAGRYSDYSLEAVGDVYTYAGGAEFSPFYGVTFRGQYQRAIRAPNISELFAGQAIGFPGAVDPCAGPAGTGVDAAGLRATCLASGVPAAVVGTPAVQNDTQIPALFGGNPNLEEETSESYTFGVVLQPTFLPGFTVTADYFNITVDDAIDTFGGGLNNALNLCFNVVQDINSDICAPFRGSRNPSTGGFDVGFTPFVGNANIASLETEGIDLQVSYGFQLPFSFFSDTREQDVNLSFLGTWTDRFTEFPIQGLDDFNECAGRFGQTCLEPRPEFKWVTRASFIDGPVTTSIRWRHLDSVTDDDPNIDYNAFGGTERIDAYNEFDLTLSVAVTEQFVFNFGVLNLLDELPEAPVFLANGQVANTADTQGTLLGDNQEQANTYPSTYDVLGRRFFVSAAFKF